MALAHLTWALVIIPVPRGMLVRGGIRAHVTTATTAMPVPATTAVLAITTAVLVPTMADGVIRITAIHPGRTRPMPTTRIHLTRAMPIYSMGVIQNRARSSVVLTGGLAGQSCEPPVSFNSLPP